MPTRLLYAASGLLATLVGVAAGHLVAALLNPDSSPVLAVGSTVIDLTPTPMKEWAIRQFGTNDKPILIGSVMAGVLVLAAIAGLLARRRFRNGAAMLVALVAIAGASAMLRPAAEIVDVVPGLVSALVAVAALWWLDRSLSGPSGTGAEHAAQPSRRGVLIAMGALGVGAALMGGAGRWIGTVRSRIKDIAFPAPASAADPLPTGLEQEFAGITPFRVSNSDFYRVDTRLDTPIVDIDGWTLTIDGDVDEELTFTFDELLEMPLIERDITLTCVSNSVGGEYVGGARWIGVRLTDLLDRAGVGSGADQILSTDFDGMTISTPLDLATDGRDSMIALGMNGEALPRAHGYPARMVVPGLYGFISATKWLTRLTLTTYADEQAYWTERDWATDAPIKPSARIDTPKSLAEVEAGRTVIGGVAWAQNDGGVAKVQVKVDGGGWQDATLGPDAGSSYWRQWYFEWDATKGQHNVAARVVDADGDIQTDVRAEPFPEGSSGIHTLILRVV